MTDQRNLLELLHRFIRREITANYLREKLNELDLINIVFPPPHIRPPVQEASSEVENKIHQMFESIPPSAGGKEQFHAENKQGKRCFDDYVAKEHEQGIFHADQGSSPFTANLPGRCVGCGQVILKGDVIIIRAKERGVA